MRALALAFLLLACTAASSAVAAPLLPSAPQLSLEFEGQYAQPSASNSRGFGIGFQLAWRFTDQLFATGAVSSLVTPGGPFSTVGAGVRALLDLTPISPFVDVQLVALGPDSVSGYNFATRIGGGADWRIAPAYAIGIAVRTLTPVSGPASGAALGSGQGLEIALRLVITPALLQ